MRARHIARPLRQLGLGCRLARCVRLHSHLRGGRAAESAARRGPRGSKGVALRCFMLQARLRGSLAADVAASLAHLEGHAERHGQPVHRILALMALRRCAAGRRRADAGWAESRRSRKGQHKTERLAQRRTTERQLALLFCAALDKNGRTGAPTCSTMKRRKRRLACCMRSTSARKSPPCNSSGGGVRDQALGAGPQQAPTVPQSPSMQADHPPAGHQRLHAPHEVQRSCSP